MSRVAEGDTGERQHYGDLRNDDQATSTPEQRAENRRVVLVEERRPNKLEFIGNS
jgi:hypothetical protein